MCYTKRFYPLPSRPSWRLSLIVRKPALSSVFRMPADAGFLNISYLFFPWFTNYKYPERLPDMIHILFSVKVRPQKALLSACASFWVLHRHDTFDQDVMCHPGQCYRALPLKLRYYSRYRFPLKTMRFSRRYLLFSQYVSAIRFSHTCCIRPQFTNVTARCL